MVVLTAGSSLGAGQILPSIVLPCSCSILTALHIGAPDEGLLCSSFSLLLHAFTCITANSCWLESKVTGAGVNPDSLISAPCMVVGSAPRNDLACRLRRSWRSSRLPTSLGSHLSSLLYSVTAGPQATWTAHTLSGTTPYVLVSNQSLAPAALALCMQQLWCFLNVRCRSIQTPSPRVACALNCLHPLLTHIFAFRFGRRCLLWPRLGVNRGASIFAVSN